MFCTQCGTNNPEGAAHCVTCGAPMGTPAAPKKSFDIKEMFNKVRSHKLFWPGVGAAALIIILLIVFGNTKTSPIDKYIKGMATADADKVMAAFPKEVLKEEDIDEDDLEDELEDDLEYMEDYFGKNIKVSYKVTDKEKWDKDDVEDFAEDLDDYYDMDEDKVTEVWTIECDVTIKGSEEKETNETEFIVFKYKGKWYLHPRYIY